MRTEDFAYDLPEDLIASRPAARRDDSRLLVVDRGRGTLADLSFRDFPGLLGPADLCVLNDTAVVKARFVSDDGRVELVRTALLGPATWKAMVRPGKRMKVGRVVTVGGVTGKVTAVADDGDRVIEFGRPVEAGGGRFALPHYLGREGEPLDDERYQTVFAREPGAIAAPTAGLHFTPEILGRVPHVAVTLHVGVGTFRPVKAEEVGDHRMHSERYRVGAEAAAAVGRAGRVVSVGTTVTRVLEHVALRHGGAVVAGEGETDIFIYPGFEFRVTGALLTNFHLPRSTLFMLVCAFAGRERMLEAYRHAVAARYRFFSYGDCMLIV